MSVYLWICLWVSCGVALHGQQNIHRTELLDEIEITKAFFEELELDNESGIVKSDPVKFPIGSGDTLLIQCKEVHTFANGGVVAEYDVLEGDAIHFLISKFGEHYYGSYFYKSWQYHIKEAISGNYVRFKEIWENETCGLVDGGKEELSFRNYDRDNSPSLSSGDPIRLLIAYGDDAILRTSQRTGVDSDTSVYLWSHVAVTMMNITLRESGSQHSVDLIDLKYVDYSNSNVNAALGAFSSLSGNFSSLSPVIDYSCIEIRSFLTDYSGSGPVGIATGLSPHSTSLSSVSAISVSTFCHELGHMLGFGHGPQGPDDAGYFSYSRAFSTEDHGIPGENLSSLMDYGRRTFIFSNLVAPYSGDYTEYNGVIFGSNERNHIGTLNYTYEIVKDISSKRVYISESICSGDSVYGYSEEGLHIDTLQDSNSCTGHTYRRLNLSVQPPLESNFTDSSIVKYYDVNQFFDSVELNSGKLISGEKYVCSNFHIYHVSGDDFNKVASFPDPDHGRPDDPNNFEVIFDFNYIMDELYVQSNLGVYIYDESNSIWLKQDNLDQIPKFIGNRKFINTSKAVFYRDPGMDWIKCNIPFPKPNDVNIFNLKISEGTLFLMQLNKKVIYLSSDSGESWSSAEIPEVIDTRGIFFYNAKYYGQAIGKRSFYYSVNGANWEPTEFKSDDINKLYHDAEKDKLYLFKLDNQLYQWDESQADDFYVGKLKYYPDFISDNHIYCVEGGAFSEDDLLVYDLSAVMRFTEQVNLCPGELFHGLDSEGPHEIMYNSTGCDSIVLVNITLDSLKSVFESKTICYGMEYKGYHTDGIKIDTFASSSGCDSIHIIDLEVLDKIENDPLIQHVSGEESGRIELKITGGKKPYSYSWSNGDTSHIIDMLEVGEYTVTVTDAIGCLYVEEFIITLVSSVSHIPKMQVLNIFPNPVKGGQDIEFRISNSSPVEISVHRISGELIQQFSSTAGRFRAPKISGIYILNFKSQDLLIQQKIMVW